MPNKAKRAVVHMAAPGRKTACGLPMKGSLLITSLSREGYERTTCKNCKKKIKRLIGI